MPSAAGVVLGVCDLKTQHQQANRCTQWPNLFLAGPVMTVCSEKSKKGFQAGSHLFCVCLLFQCGVKGRMSVCLCVRQGWGMSGCDHGVDGGDMRLLILG